MLRLKYTKIRFPLGRGAYSAPTDPFAAFKGLSSKGKRRKRKMRGGEGKGKGRGGVRGERNGGKARGQAPSPHILAQNRA